MRDTARQPAASVTVGTESTTLVEANVSRSSVYVTNNHESNTVHLALGPTAVANKGIRLNPDGGSAVIEDYRGEIAAIASGAGTVVTFSEV